MQRFDGRCQIFASSLFGVGASRATGWHWVESDDRVAGRSRRVLETLVKGRCRPAGGATSPQSSRSWFSFHRKVLVLVLVLVSPPACPGGNLIRGREGLLRSLSVVQRYDGGCAGGGAPHERERTVPGSPRAVAALAGQPLYL